MDKLLTHEKEKALDAQAMRETLRLWATGVTIVTVVHEGVQHGMTVNSFTSLSLDPPLLLVSLEKGTRTHDMVSEAKAFAVTLLSQGQEAISERFAGRESETDDRFLGVQTISMESKNPILADGLAYFDCHVQASHAAGSHTIFIAEVLAAGLLPASQAEKPPLVYYNRKYRRLAAS